MKDATEWAEEELRFILLHRVKNKVCAFLFERWVAALCVISSEVKEHLTPSQAC